VLVSAAGCVGSARNQQVKDTRMEIGSGLCMVAKFKTLVESIVCNIRLAYGGVCSRGQQRASICEDVSIEWCISTCFFDIMLIGDYWH
jgi:hypothetical protein